MAACAPVMADGRGVALGPGGPVLAFFDTATATTSGKRRNVAMKGGPAVVAVHLLMTSPVVAQDGGRWAQFRGPNASGVHASAELPDRLAPSEALWKARVPPGHSSVVLSKDRLFLTGFDERSGGLDVLCLNRTDGQLLWRRSVPVEQIEAHHEVASPAAATPVVDGEAVFAYFGSFGLVRYDLDGNEIWRKPLSVPETPYGTATSPVVGAGLLFLNGQGKEPYLLAVNPETGATVWRKQTPRSGSAHSTPIIAPGADGAAEVIVFGDAAIAAYDVRSGDEIWWMTIATLDAIATPVIGDGLLYLVSQSSAALNEGYQGTFDNLLERFDKDGDTSLSAAEVPESFIFLERSAESSGDISLRVLFQYYDTNGNDVLDRAEWRAARQFRARFDNALVALKPGGRGELSPKRLIWHYKRSLPEVPSPLLYRGKIYLVKDGGLLTCLDAGDGRLVHRERLPARGQYYASPVAGDEKIIIASNSGIVAVLRDGDEFDVMSEQQFDEPVFATPALGGNAVYIRTEAHVYAFHR